MRVRSVVAVTMLVAGMAREAQAMPSAKLLYARQPGAEACPDEATLRAAVQRRLGYDPFDPDAPATLRTDVSRVGPGYRARIWLVSGDEVRGAREIEHTGPCDDIVDAMALSMSIAIDPESLVRPASSAPDAEPKAPVDRTAPPTTAAPREGAVAEQNEAVRTTKASSLLFIAGASLAGWFGAAPSPSTGGLVHVGVRTRRFELSLEGRGDLPASLAVRLGTVRTSFIGASVVPCARFGVVLGCGVVTLGRLEASGSGVTAPREDAALHALAGMRAGVALPVFSSAEVRLATDVLVALTPQVLQIDRQDAYRMPRVVLGFALGAAVHFP